MGQKELLIELLNKAEVEVICGGTGKPYQSVIADYLLAHNVVVLPCRCEGCIHNMPENNNYCKVHMGYPGDGNFFCACAKRRES